jgi:tetratricopeptide (TPR) repeat protein
LLALVLAGSLIVPTSALARGGRARGGKGRGAAVAAPVDPAAATARAERTARLHFQRAENAFTVGKFDEALRGYEAAYEALPLPAFVFNIAQCHRNLGNHERAIFFYRRYLALEPNPPNKGLVQELIVEEQIRLQDQEAARAGRTPAPRIAPEALQPKGLPPVRASVVAPVVAPVGAGRASATAATPRWWIWGAVGGVVITGLAAALLIERQGPLRKGQLGAIHE